MLQKTKILRSNHKLHVSQTLRKVVMKCSNLKNVAKRLECSENKLRDKKKTMKLRSKTK